MQIPENQIVISIFPIFLNFFSKKLDKSLVVVFRVFIFAPAFDGKDSFSVRSWKKSFEKDLEKSCEGCIFALREGDLS
ncbi:hypothetical protein C7N43_19395 [Sphingobacteriales bacterium UPWRP_1]|nr:hypothetical protein B6N25_01890 [Sphingobacteriales bacterium TSM_CSS]PSJ75313.1 hypothetical protein C7N43_19395 [Sphingobacteriales bacterium UPWRP_1]